LNRCFRVTAIEELHEREPAGASRFAVDRQHDLGRGRNRGEVRAEIRLSSGVREITDEQANSQSLLQENQHVQ
jgi:hypothetical protein